MMFQSATKNECSVQNAGGSHLNLSNAGKLSWIRASRSMIPALWLAFGAGIHMFGVGTYLSVSLNPVILLTFVTITFGIYFLNRLMDREDAYSRPMERRLLSKNSSHMVLMVVLMFAFSFITLTATGKLSTMHLILVALGVLYTVPLLPMFSNGRITWVRIKDIVFVKSLVVSGLWGISTYGILLAQKTHYDHTLSEIVILGLGFTLAVLTNTVACDARDIESDRRAGTRTLATVLGRRRLFASVLAGLALCTAVALVVHVRGAGSVFSMLYFVGITTWALLTSRHNYRDSSDKPSTLLLELGTDSIPVISGITLTAAAVLM